MFADTRMRPGLHRSRCLVDSQEQLRNITMRWTTTVGSSCACWTNGCGKNQRHNDPFKRLSNERNSRPRSKVVRAAIRRCRSRYIHDVCCDMIIEVVNSSVDLFVCVLYLWQLKHQKQKMGRIGLYREDGKRYKQHSLKKMDESYIRLASKISGDDLE